MKSRPTVCETISARGWLEVEEDLRKTYGMTSIAAGTDRKIWGVSTSTYSVRHGTTQPCYHCFSTGRSQGESGQADTILVPASLRFQRGKAGTEK